MHNEELHAIVVYMTERTPRELRLAAQHYRAMATEGDDPILQSALLVVADEFEQEAERIEMLTVGQGCWLGLPAAPSLPPPASEDASAAAVT